MTLEEIIASLTPLGRNSLLDALQGEDLRGGSPHGYLDDSERYSDADIQQAAQQIRDLGVELVDGTNYYNTGIPQLNEALYGPDISVNLSYDGSGFETPRNLQSNSTFDLGMDILGWGLGSALGGVTGNLVGSILGDGILAPAISNAASGAVSNSVRDSFDPSLNISGVVGPNGEMPDLGEGPINNQNPLEGLLGGGLSIPIPGLPFPIPGNMGWEDLVEIARNSGRTIQEVIDSIGSDSSGGTPDAPPPQTVEEGDDTIGGVGLPGLLGREGSDPVGESEEEDLSLGQPTWWEGGSLPGIPAPVDIPDDSTTPDPQPPSLVPGETGGTPDNPGATPGNSSANSALVLGLLPFLLPDNDPAPTPEFELWDYIGADTSWGIDRPDYGTVEQAAPYQFAKQPSQPMQVGYNPDPRRDYLSVLQQEQLRRQQRGLL